MLHISEEKIISLLNKADQTERVKKKKDVCIRQHQRNDEPFANGEYAIGRKAAVRLADHLIQIIRSKLPESIADVGNTLYHTNPRKTPEGGYTITIRFDRSALHRDSLENDYMDYGGIDNIVALFNNGYHARDYVYGWWNGHSPTGEALARSNMLTEDYAWVRSVRDRDGLHFMQAAQDEFNAIYKDKYGGVQVVLGADYTKND